MYIGLDVGGTYVKAARIETSGAISRHRQVPVSRGSAAELLDQLAEIVRDLQIGGTLAIGIGVPGIIDRNGRVRVAPNLHILDGQHVADTLAQRTPLPTFLENDANAAALAEAWLGAGRGTDDL